MGNSKVALLRYVKIAGGWRRVRVEAVRRGRGWDQRLDLPDRVAVLKRGIAVVERIDEKEAAVVMGNRWVSKILLNHIVLSQRTLRWECRISSRFV